MKKLLRNRFFYALLSFLIAFVLCFHVIPSQYRSTEATTEIVKVKEHIKEGTILTEDLLTTAQVGSYGLDSSVITDISQAIGYAALVDLDPRDPIYADELVPAASYGKGGGMGSFIEEGESLVSVTMSSAAASVAGLIKPGDRVDVLYAQNIPAENGYTKTVVNHPEILKNMVIYSVMNSNLISTSTAGENTSTDLVPAVVTFIASPEQEAELVRLEHSDDHEIHLILLKDGTQT